MYTIVASSSGKGFVLNNAAPRSKSDQYEIIKQGNKLGIRELVSNEFLASPLLFSEWNNGAFADIQAALDALESLIFPDPSGGGGSGGDASAANQLTQISELQELVTLMTDLYAEQRVDFELKAVEDSNGDVFLLRITFNELTGTYGIDYIDAQGNPATPVGTTSFLNPNAILVTLNDNILQLTDVVDLLTGSLYTSGSVLSTNDTFTRVQDKIVDLTSLNEFKEITLIFHGAGGVYNGINVYDGRVYTFKVENGFILNNDIVTIPTTTSPVTGLLGIEIMYLGK